MRDFSQVCEILRNNGVELWVDLGALLGFQREGHLLEWEEDIDVGTLSTFEDIKNIEPKLEQFGWKCFKKYKGMSIQNNKRTTKIDIKFYREEGNSVCANFVVYKMKFLLPICDLILWVMHLYPPEYKYETRLSIDVLRRFNKIARICIPGFLRHCISKLTELFYYNIVLKGYKISFPRDYILPLKVMKIGSYPYKIPASPESFLSLIYGKNWKKPMKIIPGTDRYPDGSSRFLTKRVEEQRPDLIEVERFV